MNLKQTAIDGVCQANRCKAPAADPQDNPYHLCAQHFNEWAVLAKPELKPTAPRKAKTGADPESSSDLALVKDKIEPIRQGLEQALSFVANISTEAEFKEGFAGIVDKGPITGLMVLGHVRETARKQLAMFEGERRRLNRPLLDLKAMHDEIFKPALQQCEAVMTAATSRLQEYETARLAAQASAARQVQTSANDPTLLAVAHHTAAPLPEQVRSQVRFTYRVTNIAEVPREFLILNAPLVDSYIAHKRGQCTIPGLEIVEEVQIVATGRA